MKKETYCLACRKYTKSINSKIVRNRQNRSMMVVKILDLLKNIKLWEY